MQKLTKQYYGKDITIYQYSFKETQQNEVKLDEVVSFGAAYDILMHGMFRIPEGRDQKQWVGYGHKEADNDKYIVIMDGLSIKEATNIMLDLGCIDITIQWVELAVDLGIPEEVKAEEDSVIYDQPGIISWEDMTVTTGTITKEEITQPKKKNSKKK